MLKQIRKKLIDHLWQEYRIRIPHVKQIEMELAKTNANQLVLDHFALIDLPSDHTGIPTLSSIFNLLGYTLRGQGYLPDKQNDFSWMAENNCENENVFDVLPQVVVADFRLDEMPEQIRRIIIKYANQAKKAPIDTLKKWIDDVLLNQNQNAFHHIIETLCSYLAGRDWALPSVKEFQTVQEFNELLAWVLVFGRRPNHFTLSIHLMTGFQNLADFNQFIEKTVKFPINNEGGKIKGGSSVGIAQSSTAPLLQNILLSDGEVELPTEFIEFVFRYPIEKKLERNENKLWGDFFTGFVATQANQVIKSLSQFEINRHLA